ncbi:amino acid adenylation domain-containing protein [Saccharothrix sp. BKS2]|uniref:non-ribosomal peptide synthetase n=1 Tax=Saccharothrix sp. BKS2 TaxID=3064400 RepID=UPI0039E964AC
MTGTDRGAPADLSSVKRQLLANMLLARGERKARARTIRPRDPALPCPPSRGQEQLWIADSLAGGGALYHVPYGVRMRGDLDVAALRAAVDGVVARHAVLRTVYRQRPEGDLEQVVQPPAPVAFDVVDLPDEESASAAARAAAAEPLDLGTGPVIRGRLLRIAADDHLLVLVVHHIATDAWSAGILLEELAELYDAERSGRPARLPELAIDYADFAAHQREREPADHDELVERWRERMSGTEPLALFAGGDGAGARRGSRVYRRWGVDLARDLQRTADAHRTTVFTVALTAFAVLLHRYTGTPRFAVGTVMANRDGQTERLIGYFANATPVVADLSRSDTLADVLGRVAERSLWARENQVPFDVLVEGLAPERTLAESPLFDVMFVFNQGTTGDLDLPGLSFTPDQVHSGTAKFPLDLSCSVTADGVVVSLEHDESVLDADAARRLLAHYRRSLALLCAEPGLTVGSVDLLDPAEREQVVVGWNRTGEAFPDHATAHGLFEEWADRRPDAVAVVCGDDSITYRELDERANRLAHALIDLGCGRHDRVGTCLERGIDLVVAQLAVAKSGAGYVPLDRGFPAEHLRWVLADSGARFLIGGDPDLATDALTRVEVEQASPYPGTRPERGVRPEDLLYLIYTSGSTGRPKGVLLDHRGRVNNFTDFNRRFDVGPADRVFGVSALAFDMSAYDVFGTLAAGAAVVFPAPEDEKSPDRWLDAVDRHGVTVWHSVPALFGLLVEEAETRGGQRLPIRLVLLGGDWIPLSLPPRAVPLLRGSAVVVSMGGATEVSMDSTIHVVGHVDPEWRSIPYGVPMANQKAYVTDADLSPVPVGVAGELYLGGVGVGWGYHDRARLTAERFVPDPFGDVPGARLYRTGDRVRWTPDGTLELLGRIDFQVKVNGFRVETGEVEAALRDLLDGASVLVTAHGERDTARTLVAYVVAPPGPTRSDDELKRALAARLPAHMVPASFIRLESFPLTRNGKIDRGALRAPAVEAASGRPASTPTERVLAGLWQEVLGTTEVPVDAGFFALGGNSIEVIRMASAARRAGLPLTPRMVFAHQTVEALATALDQDTATGTAVEPAPAPGGPLGVTPGQRHMLTRLADSWVPGLYRMQSTLRLPFEVDPRCFTRAWEQLALRHESLRAGFRRGHGGDWERVVVEGAAPAVEELDWRDRDPAAVSGDLVALLEHERSAPVDVAVPPLWRVWLVRGPDSWWMGQVQCYLVADGWSNLVLLDELLVLYLAAVEDRRADLPPVPVIGVDQGPAKRDADTAFWRDQLAGALPSRLAAPPGALGASRFRRLTGRLAPGAGTVLRERAAAHGHTFSTLVCTGWALLAATRLDQPEITTGVVSAGRDQDADGIERAVGVFIAALPVRISVDVDESLTSLFDRFQLARAEGAEHASVETAELQRLGSDDGPLFDSVVVVANYPVSPALRARQAAGRPDDDGDGTRNQTDFSLRLDVTEDEEPRVALSYYADRLDDTAAEHLLHDYLALLGAVAAAPTATGAQVLPLRGRTGDHS